MAIISQIIKNISFAGIIISVVLLLIPSKGTFNSARKAVIYIFVVFIITAISGQEIKIEGYDYNYLLENTASLLGDETQTAIKTQLYALFKQNNITYKRVEVAWHLENDKVCVDSIEVWSDYENKDKIKAIIKENYNINGDVYGSN